ncbi:UV radiation resistance protein and autophagy-related subunit 14-domain-containing protein [Halteromyces radiatus]|uniref:UV radiation resistance protein and autophagy-related subunit 14-domain-containing protein n=1 Tax=Halteromyces radiatus TaxID=101107 RepID=UPI00221F81A0|nr:UV radiation resistance protein and autophagy-related subunit 14-domain-containing protein [Halteromyces radiatus]KAI8076756.1 UV radiation resistance protein and autophagy-related subunit 14-domain-containing protein [Halteromyces radiatus]
MRRSESVSAFVVSNNLVTHTIADSSLTKNAYKRKSKTPDVTTTSNYSDNNNNILANTKTLQDNNSRRLSLENDEDLLSWKEKGLLDTYLTMSLPKLRNGMDSDHDNSKNNKNDNDDNDDGGSESVFTSSKYTKNTTTMEQQLLFYTSETIPNSTNPVFRTDMSLIDWYDGVQNIVVVRLWAKHSQPESAALARRSDPVHAQGNHSVITTEISHNAIQHPYRLLIEWSVDLNELIFIGKSLHDIYKWPTNTLLFELDDGYYTAPDIVAFAFTQHKRSSHQDMQLDLDSASIESVYSPRTKRSYTYHHIMKLNTLKECIYDAQVSADEIQFNINEILEKDKNKFRLIRERAQKETRLKELETSIQEQQAQVDYDRKQVNDLRQSLDKRKLELKRSQERFQHGKDDLENNDTQLEKNIKMHNDTFTKLTERKKELIADLFSIYPIEQSFDDFTQFRIRGVYLPNSVYTGCNEESIAIALGFTAHLVSMLAFYLSIPLRYPINPMGSRATIYDPVSLIHGSRIFPLYGKGTDRYRFEFGVFLLNKNIEQMMNAYGLIVMDLRHTLPNIHYFIQAVLTTSVTSGPTSLSVLSISSYAQGKDRSDGNNNGSSTNGKHQEQKGIDQHGEHHLTLQPTIRIPIERIQPSPTVSSHSISHSPKLGVSPGNHAYSGVHLSSHVYAAPAILDTVTTSSCQKSISQDS